MKSKTSIRICLIFFVAFLFMLNAGSIYSQTKKNTTKTKRSTTTTTKKTTPQKTTTQSPVTLIQNFIFDAYHPNALIFDGELDYNSFDGLSTFGIKARGFYPINDKINLRGIVGFASFSPEVGNGESGLIDPVISLGYKLMSGITTITGIGYLTLPIGSEDIGQSCLNFGFGAAIRHTLDSKMALTGSLGLKFYELDTYNFVTGKKESDYESGLGLNAGFIYLFQSNMAFVGELIFDNKINYSLLSAGMDYRLSSGHHMRGALGLGLDDGAPDLMILISFMPSL